MMKYCWLGALSIFVAACDAGPTSPVLASHEVAAHDKGADFVALGAAAQVGSYDGLPTDDEIRSILRNHWTVPDMFRARNDALALSEAYGSATSGFQGDAYRHAIWNMLMVKYVGDEFTTIDAAIQFVKEFGEAHEYGRLLEPAMDRAMDLLNNRVALAIVRRYAYVSHENGPPQVHTPPVETLKRLVLEATEKAVRVSGDSSAFSNLATLGYYRTAGSRAVHRLYNSGLPDHFYTINDGEGLAAGWRLEASRYFFVSPNRSNVSQTNLYGCWIESRHYVSLDQQCERGISAERVIGAVSVRHQPGTVPLYRLIHPVTRDRLSTWSSSEMDRARSMWGYRWETITGYVWLNPQ